MPMSKKSKHAHADIPEIGKQEYTHELRRLQIERVRLHRHVIAHDLKILVILEGRDSNGEESEWYFQRFVRYLPAAQEIVLFNRSWYNRAGVEPVMKCCTPAEHEDFLE